MDGSFTGAATSVVVEGTAVSVSLSGTWVGTVVLERFARGAWQIVKTWTETTEEIVGDIIGRKWRLRCDALTSGSILYALESGGVHGIALQAATGGSGSGGSGSGSPLTNAQLRASPIHSLLVDADDEPLDQGAPVHTLLVDESDVPLDQDSPVHTLLVDEADVPLNADDPVETLIVDENGDPVDLTAPVGITVADGANVALGETSDPAWTGGDGTAIALLKAIAGGGGGGGDASAANQTTGNTSLASIDTKMSTLAGHVDGLEALTTTLNGHVDGLEALITTLNGYIDGLEALLGKATTAAITSVAASASTVTILAANANRLGCKIVNDDEHALRIAFGVAASATVYSELIPSGGSYTMTRGELTTVVIHGIWTAAGSGSARVTELTP